MSDYTGRLAAAVINGRVTIVRLGIIVGSGADAYAILIDHPGAVRLYACMLLN